MNDHRYTLIVHADDRHPIEPGIRALAEWFDERAAIGEYEGNMNRGEAERSAYIEVSRGVEGGGR